MRYLHRTHRVSVARLHEAYQRKDFDLVYELTTRMCADIYTKAFVDSGKWEAACELINIVDPKWLQRVISQRAAQDKETLQEHNEGVHILHQDLIPRVPGRLCHPTRSIIMHARVTITQQQQMPLALERGGYPQIHTAQIHTAQTPPEMWPVLPNGRHHRSKSVPGLATMPFSPVLQELKFNYKGETRVAPSNLWMNH